jgi:hypothetical protein
VALLRSLPPRQPNTGADARLLCLPAQDPTPLTLGVVCYHQELFKDRCYPLLCPVSPARASGAYLVARKLLLDLGKLRPPAALSTSVTRAGAPGDTPAAIWFEQCPCEASPGTRSGYARGLCRCGPRKAYRSRDRRVPTSIYSHSSLILRTTSARTPSTAQPQALPAVALPAPVPGPDPLLT